MGKWLLASLNNANGNHSEKYLDRKGAQIRSRKAFTWYVVREIMMKSLHTKNVGSTQFSVLSWIPRNTFNFPKRG